MRKNSKLTLQFPDYIILTFILFCSLLIIWLDLLAHRGVGIDLNLFGTPRTSYAILVEIIMFSSIAIYGIVKRNTQFLFVAGILLLSMFTIGWIMGAD